MKCLDISADVVTEDSATSVLKTKTLFTAAVAKAATYRGFILVKGDTGAGVKMELFEKEVLRNCGDRDVGRAPFSLCDLACGAEWWMAGSCRRILGNDARVDCDGGAFCRRGRGRDVVDGARAHELLKMGEAHMPQPEMPKE